MTLMLTGSRQADELDLRTLYFPSCILRLYYFQTFCFFSMTANDFKEHLKKKKIGHNSWIWLITNLINQRNVIMRSYFSSFKLWELFVHLFLKIVGLVWFFDYFISLNVTPAVRVGTAGTRRGPASPQPHSSLEAHPAPTPHSH